MNNYQNPEFEPLPPLRDEPYDSPYDEAPHPGMPYQPDPRLLEEQLLTDLNPAQKEAVTHTGSPLLIVAGAGSGKTTVLTRRIAYLLGCRGVQPWQILAITFTNKAANEMRERISAQLGPASNAMWILTFHAACVRILRENAAAIPGLSPNFTIYDTSDTLQLVKLILKDLGPRGEYLRDRQVLNFISNCKNELKTPEEVQADASDPQAKLTADIYAEYQKRLLAANAVDFDDLIGYVVSMFRSRPGIVETYRRRFRHVLIDEYQDTNRAQYELVHLLVGDEEPSMTDAGQINYPGPELCVVGDADQSIYAFRGADIRNIMDFNEDFPHARTIVLDQNYRSTQNILSAANSVIAQNERTQDKKLWSELGDGEKIHGYIAANEHDEAFNIIRAVERLHDQGYKYSDMAVMYRMNYMSRPVEDAFVRAGLPYTVVGGIRFYEREEIRDIIAYLRVLDNPNDDMSLRRIYNVPRRAIGETTFNRIVAHATTLGISYWEAFKDGIAGRIPALTPRNIKAIAPFVQLIEQLRAQCTETNPDGSHGEFVVEADRVEVGEGVTLEDLQLSDGDSAQAAFSAEGANDMNNSPATPAIAIDKLIERLVESTGYRAQLEKSVDPKQLARLDNIQELVSAAQEFGHAPLAEFLEKVSLRSDSDNIPDAATDGDDPNDVVALMTLHTAKGLEYPVVFLIAWEDSLFPHSRSLIEEGGLEEERRLAYVGITRAKRHLFISRAATRQVFNSTESYPGSRFLDDIPDELIEWEGEENDMRSSYYGGSTVGSAGWGGNQNRAGSGFGSSRGTSNSGTTNTTTRGTSSGNSAFGRPRQSDSGIKSSTAELRGLMPGDMVNHSKYGLGTVIEMTNSKPAPTAKIKFGSHGVIRIMLLGNIPMEKL